MNLPFPRSGPLMVLAVLLVGVALPVHAQIYSWTDPATGQRRMAGDAPGWYGTGPVRGPRTVVTLGVFLLDDTGLGAAERARLQATAKRHLADRAEADKEDEQGATGAAPAKPAPPPPPVVSRGGPRRDPKP